MRPFYESGYRDCVRDRCEDTPFASVGGVAKRTRMEKPRWVATGEWNEYRNGYIKAAHDVFGQDWMCSPFRWGRATGGVPR